MDFDKEVRTVGVIHSYPSPPNRCHQKLMMMTKSKDHCGLCLESTKENGLLGKLNLRKFERCQGYFYAWDIVKHRTAYTIDQLLLTNQLLMANCSMSVRRENKGNTCSSGIWVI